MIRMERTSLSSHSVITSVIHSVDTLFDAYLVQKIRFSHFYYFDAIYYTAIATNYSLRQFTTRIQHLNTYFIHNCSVDNSRKGVEKCIHLWITEVGVDIMSPVPGYPGN
jgi:hypothetical protein